MNISKFFIVRPVATTLLMLALLFSGYWFGGFYQYQLYRRSIIPLFRSIPSLGNPDTVQRTITAPLEREMGKIAGLKQMSSQSSVGASVITCSLN
jgi:multidrug efflux pump